MVLPVTSTLGELAAIAMFSLVGWIGLLRGRLDILRGDGGHAVLFKRIRVHGNFIETAPLAILAMAAAESLNVDAVWLWMALASYLAGRVLHVLLYDRKARGLALTLVTGPFMLLGLVVLQRLWLP